MSEIDTVLGEELAAIRAQGLSRRLCQVDSTPGPRLRLDGRELLNFSSNDYLGLADHPAIKEAAVRAIERYGAGSGASRLVCGSLTPHHALEEALSAFKGTPRALTFSSGYATALGTICALVSKDDVIIVDRLVHACIVDAARLSGAKIRVFAHNDLEDLERILTWARSRTSRGTASNKPPRVLVVTESLFSMDGDQAPLAQLVELKDRFGAWLMVDEAHATGVYGHSGRGLADAHRVAGRIEVQMGTLGKALGAAGGYICGSSPLIDLLINRARSFIFSTAPVPAAAGAARAAVEWVQSKAGEERRGILWERVTQLQGHVSSSSKSAIIPLIVGAEDEAVRWATLLRERGLFVPAIRFPTVARGQARLRITLSAAHTAQDVAALLESLPGERPHA